MKKSSFTFFASRAKLPQSRKEKLQAELKLLEWHKMANNAAIKVGLNARLNNTAPTHFLRTF